jgi:hypothetical protein
MEDDVAVQTHPNSGSNPFACEWGARCVLRFSETPTVGSHGPEGSDRGIRHIEVYNNNMHMANTASWNNGSRNGKAVSVRSGTAMVFNNDITSSTNDYVVATELSYYRCNLGAAHICRAYNPWGICDGTSAWDKIPSTGPYPCLDGIGRGQGVLVNRSSPAWPNQVLDPVYSWGNRMQGNQYPGISAHPVGNPPQFTENVDYYNEVSGFNGTLGVGRGALAKRPNCSPTACTAGVAYWATDQGNWNHSGKAAWDGSTQGTLYRWTGSAWETYYVPFPYPHPLVTEAGGAESQLESH